MKNILIAVACVTALLLGNFLLWWGFFYGGIEYVAPWIHSLFSDTPLVRREASVPHWFLGATLTAGMAVCLVYLVVKGPQK